MKIYKKETISANPKSKTNITSYIYYMWIFENFYNSDNFCRNGNQMHFREQTADHMYSVRYCSAWPEPHEHKC